MKYQLEILELKDRKNVLNFWLLARGPTDTVQKFNKFGNIFKFEKNKPKNDTFYLIFYLYQSLDKIKIKYRKLYLRRKMRYSLR